MRRSKRRNPLPNLEPPPDALARVAKRHGIRLIVLFGSHSRGFARPESDVDLAFEFDYERKMRYEALWEELIPIFESDNLDLVDLSKAPPLLAWCVATTGRLIFERDNKSWNCFRKRAVKEFEDVRHFDRWRLARVDRAIREARGQ